MSPLIQLTLSLKARVDPTKIDKESIFSLLTRLIKKRNDFSGADQLDSQTVNLDPKRKIRATQFVKGSALRIGFFPLAGVFCCIGQDYALYVISNILRNR